MSDTALPGSSPRRVARPNGWWGLAVFVASEGTLFSTLVGTYFYLRFKTLHWPPAGIDPPSITVPLVMTGVLVASALPVAFAAAAARRGRAAAARLGILTALVLQAGYFAFEIHSFADDLGRFRPDENAYASIYYTLLGADHAHVAIGLLFSLFVVAKLTTGLTHYRAIAVQALAFYWYFVAALTLAVTGTVLSASV